MNTFKCSMMAAGSLLLGGFASLTPLNAASAADLGGSCCHDLEQRVAELEATTARKGNTKVSLTVYGQVNRALLGWNDGHNGDAYVVDPSVSSSRFGFQGKAKMMPGWTAGFNIEIELQDDASSGVDQDVNNMINHSGSSGVTSSGVNGSAAGSLRLRQSNWYVESERLGRLTVGLQNTAAKDGINLNLSNSLSTADNFYSFNFKVRTSTGGYLGTWGQYANALDTARLHAVRYDTPSLYGFIASASWGENDFWDVALRFAREWNSFKFAAYGGYAWMTDAAINNLTAGTTAKRERWTASGSLMHVPTGLFVNVTGGEENADFRSKNASFIYGQFGIERKLLPYGATTLYGEVGEYDNFATLNAGLSIGGAGPVVVTDSKVTRWGAGVTQKVDSAALDLFTQYHHYEADTTVVIDPGLMPAQPRIEDWYAVLTGARIKF